MKIRFKMKGLWPYQVKLLKADFEFNLWDTQREIYNLLQRIKKDRRIMDRMTMDQYALFDRLEAQIRKGKKVAVDYKIERIEKDEQGRADVWVVLEISQEYVDFYKTIRDNLNWLYRKAMDIIITPERLAKKMAKVGKEYYGNVDYEILEV